MEGSREETGTKSLSVEPRKERRGSYLSIIQKTGHRHLNAKKFQEVAAKMLEVALFSAVSR
jgi:hypothetical protein